MKKRTKYSDMIGQIINGWRVKEVFYKLDNKNKNRAWVIAECPMCHKDYETMAQSIRGKNYIKGCYDCSVHAERNHIDRAGKTYNGIYVKEEYGRAKHGYKWLAVCPMCGKDFVIDGSQLGVQKSCYTCHQTNQWEDLTGQRFGKLTAIERIYRTDKTRHNWWLCQCDCGGEKIVEASELKRNNVSSCGCLTSKGELDVMQWLNEYDITYEKEKSFPELGLLRYDFYLPQLNTIIEYHGEQHFKPVDIWGGEDGYIARVEHDLRKELYCERNGVRLIIIPYYQPIEEALKCLIE